MSEFYEKALDRQDKKYDELLVKYEKAEKELSRFKDTAFLMGDKIGKRDKLLGIYSRMVAKYKSYLSEDDDEIIHEANKELQELK